MKIGIITFNSAHNYGAVLQCYALQEYLRGEGHEVEIINYRIAEIDNLYRLYKPGKAHKKAYVNQYRNFKQRLKVMIKEPDQFRKYQKFEHFINHKLNTTHPFRSYNEIQQASFNYDIMIAGSDQIWNGGFTRGVNPAYFLSFGKEKAKRISYAASIGIDTISEHERDMFQLYLKGFDYISVREENAKNQIQPLTDKEVTVVLDPTLLLAREKYEAIKKDPHINGEYIYVHNVHLLKVDERLNAIVEELSKKTGLPVVHNRSDYSYSNQLKQQFTSGSPEEFLGWIANARYTVCNSFHATVFSIIFEKEFITVPHYVNPDRMKFLLNSLGIGEHLIGEVSDLPDKMEKLKINYVEVNKKKAELQKTSFDFLKNAIQGEKTIYKPVPKDGYYFDTKDKFTCYGCGLCRDICPTHAITMEPDKEGFLYPVINEEKCTHCGKCRNECIYHRDSQNKEADKKFPKVYAAYNKDQEVVDASTSGGMFTPLYRNMLKQGGKVVGVKYNDSMEVVYDIAENEKECEAFRGSKYVAAESSDIKPRVKQLLEKGDKVLFSGNPCQIAALKKYLKNDHKNLYTVEVICHGTPSPKVFKLYLEFLEKKYKSKIVKFQFRYKAEGWSTPYVLVEFASGEILLEEARRNNLNRAFLSNYIERPSCYNCEFAAMKRGTADITIGDFWGIENEIPDMVRESGTSVLKINSEKGLEMFQQIKDQLVYKETTYKKAYAMNHKTPMKMMIKRRQLMSQIDEAEIDTLLESFNHLKKRK